MSWRAKWTQAPAALVVDATSPVVWGRSLPWLGDDAAALEAVGRELLVVEGDADDDGDEAATAAPASLSEAERAVWLLCARAVAIGRRAMRQEDKAKRIIDTVHDRGGERPVVLRSLAALYLLILPFDAERPLSDLRTWPALRSAAPRLERIIASLPPVDPPPKRGRVVPLKR